MAGFGSLYVGVSGLRTSQDALNTTAHNIANVETEGFVRQQVIQGDKMYATIGYSAISAQQVGLGVQISDVRQVRDMFLDQEYRKEAGRSAFYQACYEASYETETFFQELEGATYQDALKDLWNSIAELSKTPESKVNKEYMVLKASEFLDRSASIYNSLSEYQDNLNQQVLEKVNRINELGQTIKYYNDKIAGIELGGVEEANDYRDARNLALDELAGLANISYTTDSQGYVTVKIEGSQFVNRDRVNEISVSTDVVTGFYTPIWKHEGNSEVFDLSTKISTELDSNVGSLKAIMLARGDRRANYSDIASLNQAVENGNMTSEDAAKKYEEETGYSVVMKMQAEFDQLVHGVVTMINDTLCMDNYQSADGPDAELFIRIGEPERYQKDANGNYLVDADGYYIEIEEDFKNYDTLYTTGNLMINPAVMANSGLLDFTTDTGATDYNMAQMLVEQWDAAFATLNPTEEGMMSFSTYYAGMTDSLSNLIYVYEGIADGQEAMANSTNSKRQQVMGVSSDEELTNMVRFQNAYNASSRYINVVDEMLEHLLNTLGV